ncbi:EamA family transporter [Rhizobium paknamense]|uniref:Drug/metabolite transporter (DMT)-like permease n=1 Tax=Rhizobium paknamense TaxID=1206817 RepID=A0ABU0IEU7_9HYPH|nr:EamA family transporter [Rhizobium paknamense]MDQ0455739.1 drug/metabolite transporter (DMT)-like permease [Rhizobium paknamense]
MRVMHLTWTAIPALNVLQQVFLKYSAAAAPASDGASWLMQVLGSPWFLAAIAAEAACFLVWMTVLSELDLAKAFPLSAISYVLVMAAAWLLFGERVLPLQILGSGLILAGIFCIATAGRKA